MTKQQGIYAGLAAFVLIGICVTATLEWKVKQSRISMPVESPLVVESSGSDVLSELADSGSLPSDALVKESPFPSVVKDLSPSREFEGVTPKLYTGLSVPVRFLYYPGSFDDVVLTRISEQDSGVYTDVLNPGSPLALEHRTISVYEKQPDRDLLEDIRTTFFEGDESTCLLEKTVHENARTHGYGIAKPIIVTVSATSPELLQHCYDRMYVVNHRVYFLYDETVPQRYALISQNDEEPLILPWTIELMK